MLGWRCSETHNTTPINPHTTPKCLYSLILQRVCALNVGYSILALCFVSNNYIHELIRLNAFNYKNKAVPLFVHRFTFSANYYKDILYIYNVHPAEYIFFFKCGSKLSIGSVYGHRSSFQKLMMRNVQRGVSRFCGETARGVDEIWEENWLEL